MIVQEAAKAASSRRADRPVGGREQDRELMPRKPLRLPTIAGAVNSTNAGPSDGHEVAGDSVRFFRLS